MIKMFDNSWEEYKIPIAGRVAVIDLDNIFEIGLSAMQMVQLGGGDYILHGATVKAESNNKTIDVAIYNAGGIESASGENNDGIRISRGVADALNLLIGDNVIFVGIDTKIRPIRRHQ